MKSRENTILLVDDEDDILEIIETFKESGVKKVGPCHCSGDESQRLFADEYGKNFLHLGVGEKIIFP